MKRGFNRFTTVVLACLFFISSMPIVELSAFADDNNQVIKVGFFEYPGYHDIENGVKSGYGFDFLSLLSRYTDLNYEYVGYDKNWEDMQQMLLDGQIDMVTSARKTSEREELFDYSEPIGTNSAQINVRYDDERFIPGDYEALNNIVIGELVGNSRNEDMTVFAEEKGFEYVTVEYENVEELQKALVDGKVDAIATSSLRRTSGEKTIAEFAPQEFYCIVKKGNKSLLNEINYGISQMDINEGNWRDDLYYKNYGSEYTMFLSFTKREREYIEKVRRGDINITVAVQTDANPYSYIENGAVVGIIPDYFKHLMDMADLPYTILIAKDRTEFHDWVVSNYTDAVIDFRYGSSIITEMKEFGLVTDSYMNLTSSRVTRKGFAGEVRTIATVDSWGIQGIKDDLANNAKTIQYPTREDAMRAVSIGEADVCYVYTYTAEKFINTDPNSNLQSTILKEPVYNEFIYVSPNTNHELCSILNKCIKSDTTGSLDEYIKKYTMVTYDNLGLWEYLMLNPTIIIICAISFVITLTVFLLVLYRTRIIKTRNQQLSERLERLDQIKGLASQFSILYFVNLQTLKTENYYLDAEVTPDEAKEIDEEAPNFFEAFKSSMVIYSHPDYKDELLKFAEPEYMKEVLKDKRRHEFRFLCMNATGGYSWTDMIIMKFSENEDDVPINIAVGYYNTDDEEKARIELLNKLEQNLEAIQGLADEYDTLQFVDLDSNTYSLYYMVDYSPEKAKNLAEVEKSFTVMFEQSMNEFCHPDYLENMLKFKDIDYIRNKLDNQSKFTYRFLCNSNRGYRWCEFAIIRLDKENIPKRIAVGYTDVDDDVKSEEEHKKALTEALVAAEVANKAKTDFLFNMSHDIRTPMNAIIGFTNMAQKSINDPEKLSDSLEKTMQASNLLLSLINSILDMSRIESGKAQIDENPGDVRYSFANIQATAQELALAKNISLSFEIGDVEDYYVFVDYERCTRIFMNIITNSIKYTKEGGFVKVKCEQIGKQTDHGIYKYTIEDNGIGMSEEFQKHVFDQFSREENSTTRGIQGTGLGLSVVKSFVELLNGTIVCNSKQGVGTTFIVTLPFRLQTDKDRLEYINPDSGNHEFVNANDSDNHGKINFNGKKVLLVEDNEMNREIAIDILEDEGFIVEPVFDGSLAVKTMKEKGPAFYDVILMDIQMPIMGGYEATEAIRKMYPDLKIPIIALSANAFAEDREASIAAGMDDHVAKPININELFRVLSRFV